MRISTPPTREAHLEQFLESLRRQDLSAATVQAYSYDVTAFLRWLDALNGPTALDELAQADLLRYREHLVAERKTKPATVNRRMEALRRLCRWAHGQHILERNLAEDMKRVRHVKRHRPQELLEGEVHALLRTAGSSRHGLAQRNYAIVQCLLQTGIRVGELCALQVGDVVLRDRTGRVRVRAGKGRKEREVPLNASGRRALRQYLDERPELKSDDPLFLSTRGDSMAERTAQHVISEMARRARVSRLRVSAHTLRHTFAHNYLRDNPGRLQQLAALLGHESLDTTALYTRPSFEELAHNLERSSLNVYR